MNLIGGLANAAHQSHHNLLLAIRSEFNASNTQAGSGLHIVLVLVRLERTHHQLAVINEPGPKKAIDLIRQFV